MTRSEFAAISLSFLAALFVGRKRLRCAWRGYHIPKRVFIGGSRCEECSAACDPEFLRGKRWSA